jgi:hypothetical protein
MRPTRAFERVRAARAMVGQAAQLVASGRLDLLASALDQIEAAAGEMRLAEGAIRSGERDEFKEILREAALLKREIARMTRVADGCAALYRERSIHLGNAAVSYTPHGRSYAETPSAAACEMQA